MNSIRRARSRPRGESVNFRSFWWLVRIEAAWRVCYPHSGWSDLSEVRSMFTLYRSHSLRRRAEWIIEQHPERRWYS